MPAALLALLAAFAGVFGMPATAADGPTPSRPVVREPAAQRVVAPARSASVAGAVSSAAVRAIERATTLRSGPVPTAAVSSALLLLGLAVLGRVVGGGGGWSLPRRTPGSRRGRGPPAYVLA